MSRKGGRRNQIISTQSSAKGKTRKFVHFRCTRDRKNSLLDKNHAWNEGKWNDHDKSKESYWWWSRLIMYICYKINTWTLMIVVVSVTLADPDLQMRKGGGGGGSHPDPEIRGGSLQKTNFSALLASVWSKDRGGRPPGPLSWIRHWVMIIMY